MQHAKPPCPSPSPGVHSHSRPTSWWCYPAISFCRPLFLLPPIPPSISLFQWVNSSHEVAKVALHLFPCLNFSTSFLKCAAATAAAKSLQSCPTLCDPHRWPTRLRCPWGFLIIMYAQKDTENLFKIIAIQNKYIHIKEHIFCWNNLAIVTGEAYLMPAVIPGC